jgi:hypothetical protein
MKTNQTQPNQHLTLATPATISTFRVLRRHRAGGDLDLFLIQYGRARYEIVLARDLAMTGMLFSNLPDAEQAWHWLTDDDDSTPREEKR